MTEQRKKTQTIIQWNCRGIKPNYNELLILISLFNPAIICLQETFLKNNNLKTTNYEQYHYIHNTGSRANGGTSILVRNDIPQSKLNVQTNLQAITTQVTLHKTITICSIYLPPHEPINNTELKNLIKQLPSPFILLGDFNSHSTLWGCKETNTKGIKIEQLINDNNLCLLNQKEPTYISPSNGATSAIDLTMCDPSSFLDYTWSTYEDTCGSDHYPILINYNSTIQNNTPRWNTNRADWTKFKQLCSQKLTKHQVQSMKDFTQILISIAKECIPKKSPPSKRNKPWFNPESKKAIRQRKAALRKFKKQPTTDNLIEYKYQRAKARKTIKESKQNCWHQFINQINTSTKAKTIWKMIRKISGKHNPDPNKHLFTKNNKITEIKDIADILAKTFAENSSSKNYNQQFQILKENQEKYKINFDSNNQEPYNELFTLNELKDAIEKSHNSAVGPDEVHYSFLKQIPPESIQLLLQIYNIIWTTKEFPENWKLATIIPIAKPGKDASNPENYRPIALTSCLCKTLERMVNRRLVWYLEINNIISKNQCGYQKDRGCIDHITNLETYIREAFIKKQHVTTVFFDLEKAYDTTWKYGIIKDLHNIGLKGRLPEFLKNFLTNRSFKVRIGSTLSEPQYQEEGVPQGSILSTTLFNIKINNIIKELSPDIYSSLYVDDCSISYRSKYIHIIERKLQYNINRINKWAKNNGFKFSKTKSKCIHFCKHRKLHNDPFLQIEKEKIPFVKEHKHLGIIFDNKLTFKAHINHIKTKCNKTLQVLRVLAHTDWGADRNTLLKIYRTLVRSKLDYCSFIYQSTRKSYLKTLYPVCHSGLRLALGAFQTSPVESLYAAAQETPPELRCLNLALRYYIKLIANPTNPAHNSTLKPNYESLFDQKENEIKTFGLRIKPICKEANLPIDKIHKTVPQKLPPWKITTPEINLSLCNYNKGKTHPITFKEKFEEIIEKFPEHTHIYTDGSKQNNTTTSAAIINKETRKTKRLPKNSSIFSAEIYAINLALNLIKEKEDPKYIIFTDSQSAIIAIKNKRTNNPLIADLLIKFQQLKNKNEIILCWVPSHVGIQGNELADTAAKSAHNNPIDPTFKIPHTDMKRSINIYIQNKWQIYWNNFPNNKLYKIMPKITKLENNQKTNRKQDVILTRLKIGHTYLTHSYLLKGETQPQCIACQTPLTVKHLLTECIDFSQTREKHYKEKILGKIFEKNTEKILSYIKEIGFFHRI